MVDRGQSELLGFVFIFAIVLVAITFVSVVGFSALGDAQDFQRSNNAERAFEVLSSNVDDMVHQGAPSRATEIRVRDAQLFLEEPVTVTINGTQVADPSTNFSYSYETRPIVYRGPDDTELVYSSGATIRDDPTGMRMLDGPDLLLEKNQTVIQIVHLRSRHQRSVGEKTVQVRTENQGSELVRANTTPYNLTLAIDTPRAELWERYLEREHDVTCSTSGTTVACSISNTDRVYVAVSRIDVTVR